jgi:hypothetical protein
METLKKKIVVRGQVAKPIMYPKNGSDVKCVFDLLLIVKDGTQAAYQGVRFRVVGDPKITEKCKQFVEDGIRLTVVGMIETSNLSGVGVHKLMAEDLFTDKIAI